MSVRAVPKQWYRIEQNAAADAAEVWVYDEISPWGITANDFVADLVGIPHSLINLHMNTPGGDVYDGIAIYNALKNHPATVNIYVEGLAASIGTVIAMAGDRIVMSPHSKMMIHEAWAMSAGNASDFAKMAERLEATSQNIADIYAERAGQTPEHWRDLMRAETWYTDKEAVASGLADEVGRSNDQNALRQAAAFDLSIFRYGEQEAARLREEASADSVTVSDSDGSPTHYVAAGSSDGTHSPAILSVFGVEPIDGEPITEPDPVEEPEAAEPVVETETNITQLTTREMRREAVDRVLEANGI